MFPSLRQKPGLAFRGYGVAQESRCARFSLALLTWSQALILELSLILKSDAGDPVVVGRIPPLGDCRQSLTNGIHDGALCG